MTADTLNGVFEIGGALLTLGNVRRVRRDKKVRGVDWRVMGFFAAWSWWNLFYYPSLGQWVSAIGAVIMVVTNTLWVLLAWKYRHQ